MYKVQILLTDTRQFAHVVVEELSSVRDTVQEVHGTKNFNIYDIRDVELGEAPEQTPAPMSLRIELFVVGTSFVDGLANGEIHTHLRDARETLSERMLDNPDKALGVFGFDTYVVETTHHWSV